MPVTLAAAERVGVELGGDLPGDDVRAARGDLLPEHLVAQQQLNGEEA